MTPSAYQWIQNICGRSLGALGYSQLHCRAADFIFSYVRSALHLDVGVGVVVSSFDVACASDPHLPWWWATTNASVCRCQRPQGHGLTVENPVLLLLRRGHLWLRIPSIRGRSEAGLIQLLIIGTAPCRARRRVVVVLHSGLGSRLDRDRLSLVTGFL